MLAACLVLYMIPDVMEDIVDDIEQMQLLSAWSSCRIRKSCDILADAHQILA